MQKSLDLVVLSPGVPTDIPLVKSFYEQGLPVWGEVELAYQTGKGKFLRLREQTEKQPQQHFWERLCRMP